LAANANTRKGVAYLGRCEIESRGRSQSAPRISQPLLTLETDLRQFDLAAVALTKSFFNRVHPRKDNPNAKNQPSNCQHVRYVIRNPQPLQVDAGAR
jgi:hypothetical protein